MAKQVQFRGGTEQETSQFTGAEREITVDTTNNTLVVHDGVTEGGHKLAKEESILAVIGMMEGKVDSDDPRLSDPLSAQEVKQLYESNPDTNTFTDQDQAKLNSIAPDATANATDAYLLERANHTGTQAISTVDGLQGELDAIDGLIGDIGSALQSKEQSLTAGANITIDRTDPANPIISATGGGGGDGAVQSVQGRTGDVVITADDVGLGNVDNTSDADKPVSTAQQAALNLKLDANANAVSATKLATARTINGESFDGTANITIPVGITEDTWYLGTDKVQTNTAATGTVTLNLASASIFDLTLTGNATLSVSNAVVPAGETRSVVVRIRQGATARTLTWWAGITWLASTTPAAPAVNKIKEYVLSYDGSSWIGREGASN